MTDIKVYVHESAMSFALAQFFIFGLLMSTKILVRKYIQ